MRNVKKVESFSRLVVFCTGCEGKYNPGQPNLRIDALVAYMENAKQAMERVTNAKSLYEMTVNSRKDEFKSLDQLAPNIFRTLKTSGATQEDLKDARGFIRQIAGYALTDRKPIPSAEAEELKKRRSNLQLAYTSKVDWFSKLVQAVENQPTYTASVEGLTKTGLKAKVNQLMDLNHKVLTLYADWNKARMERDKILFHNADSLYKVMSDVKDEVCVIFGSNSPEYATVKALRFTKPAK